MTSIVPIAQAAMQKAITTAVFLRRAAKENRLRNLEIFTLTMEEAPTSEAMIILIVYCFIPQSHSHNILIMLNPMLVTHEEWAPEFTAN